MRRAWLHLLDFSQQKPPRPSLFQPEHSQLLQPLLISDSSVCYYVCNLSLDSLQYVHISLVLGSPAQGKALQVSPQGASEKGNLPFPWPAGSALHQGNKEAVALLCYKDTHLPTVPSCNVDTEAPQK